MRDKVSYEWVKEDIDSKTQDIIDNDFADDLTRFSQEEIDPRDQHIALIRFVGNNEDGLKHRAYAYLVQEGHRFYLPEYFDDGIRVPQQFHVNLKRSNLKPAFITLAYTRKVC